MTEIKKVLLFGSTGRIGAGLLKRLVKEFEVSVFVRTPSKLPDDMKDKVTVIQGDVLKTEDVEKAIEGHDAVISSIGPHKMFGTSTILAEGMKNMLSGMNKSGVPKIIVVDVGFGYERGKFKNILFSGITPIGDHVRQMELLEADKDVSWVAIATPWVKYVDTVNSTYMVELNKRPGVNEITSGEMADFMVKILKNDEEYKKYHRGRVGMSSKPKSGWFS